MRNWKLPLILLLLLAAGFGWGILQLFHLRFETGDVYPAYSTLRSDPLGASAFYESLERVPGISVSRDFNANDQMPEGRGLAYLHLAGNREEWEFLPSRSFKEIEAFVLSGGRLVVALSPEPVRYRPFPSATKPQDKDKNKKPDPNGKEQRPAKPNPAGPNKKTSGGDPAMDVVSLSSLWGIGFDVHNVKQGADGAYTPITVTNSGEPSLPATMSWHSGVVMTNLAGAWRVIYARGGDPVLVERRFGAGTVVFSSDSYCLSNEAMQKDRRADLLAWFIGPCRKVMFDEAHFGIVNSPGVALLLRKYRLYGLIAGFLLLAGLFIWKNSMGFGPPREDAEAALFVEGKDSASGFVNLLRQYIKPRDLLKTCVSEWSKSAPTFRLSVSRVEQIEELMRQEEALPPKDRNAVRAYQAICAILKKAPELQPPNTGSQVNPQKI